jgi:restriction endonuclease Mrr
MDDFQFEHLVADLWEEQGWTTEVEQQSGDAGVDVRATKTQPYSRKALIQAKRYSDKNPVGGPDIQQYSALKQQESDVDEAIIVTTGRFTGSAEDRARDLNVKTIDGEELVDLIDSLGARLGNSSLRSLTGQRAVGSETERRFRMQS